MVVAPSQGPPGTGKTTAILGIASVLLSPKGELSTGAKTALPDAHKPPEPKRYKQSSAAKRWQQEHQKELEQAAEKEAKDPWISSNLKARPDRRVLICAQSNAAVDELVRFIQHAMSRYITSFHFKICQLFAFSPHVVIFFRVDSRTLLPLCPGCNELPLYDDPHPSQVQRLLRDGVWGADGAKRMPAIVRLGRAEATLEAAKLVHVDAVAVRGLVCNGEYIKSLYVHLEV